ncbi:histidinol phosphatase [Methanosarcina mazei]|uniref:Histidinol phosphatase n=1 Tax=Methanosarcina mazei TaxID=2209 RepID=A0A0F8DWP9_METMZ|nr:PHP domain-containing protein [Methanosarcina mazei]KKG07103.1 histidinol phosphatase [Methanosarcina mazei]KKH38033.1 histidinol phosphatase [Methanosarcina mazei]KKH38393.1 histidinol phosphatase [Methanosarcina mazei]KKH45996.1 histidinol phosphatase [Methanosarcina mazei]KKH54231.1 histidinol phosphatase [Methanosarcina mazei]
MKTWEKFSDFLLIGEWHVHTCYTDGKNSIDEYCQKAVAIGLPLIAFTEHVRKNLDYDFHRFLNDIEIAKEKYDLIILSGCEAKVLPYGELDVSDDILKEIDYPIFAFHSFPKDTDLYFESLKKVLKNKHVNAWAHPGVFLIQNGLELSEDQLIDIFHSMSKLNVLLEINIKYQVPSETWKYLSSKFSVKFVKGGDVHSAEQLFFNI